MCSMAAAALWEGEQDDGLVLLRRWRIWCGGPTDMVAAAEALARVACRGGEDGAWSGG